jgi:hypothetical protein
MKNLLFLCIILSMCFFSCESQTKKTDANTTIEENNKEIVNTTAEKGSAGSGNALLKVGDNNLDITGVCGAVTSMGSTSIVIKDSKNEAKIFTVNFNGTELPATTTTYKIVKSGDIKTDEVTVSVTDAKNAGMDIWESDDQSGSIKIEVSGNNISATFSGIKLQPNAVYNKAPMDKPAVAEGKFSMTR